MITRGKPYNATGEDAKARNIRKRRVVYTTAGQPTHEQKRLIDKIEKGVVDGEWNTLDPYNLMRTAEVCGIDFYEEELRSDGRWYLVGNPDAEMTLMQTGAL